MELQLNASPKQRKLAAAALGLGSLLAAGCNVSPDTTTASPTATAAATAQPYLNLVPDLRGFLHDSSHCHDYNKADPQLSERPCAVKVRAQPVLAAPVVNAAPGQTSRLDYPLEAYNGKPGDTLTAVCVVQDGQAVGDYINSSPSQDWYGVLIAPDHIKNPVVEASFQAGDISIDTTTYAGKTYLLGYASVEWFHQTQAQGNLPTCSTLK